MILNNHKDYTRMQVLRKSVLLFISYSAKLITMKKCITTSKINFIKNWCAWLKIISYKKTSWKISKSPKRDKIETFSHVPRTTWTFILKLLFSAARNSSKCASKHYFMYKFQIYKKTKWECHGYQPTNNGHLISLKA